MAQVAKLLLRVRLTPGYQQYKRMLAIISKHGNKSDSESLPLTYRWLIRIKVVMGCVKSCHVWDAVQRIVRCMNGMVARRPLPTGSASWISQFFLLCRKCGTSVAGIIIGDELVGGEMVFVWLSLSYGVAWLKARKQLNIAITEDGAVRLWVICWWRMSTLWLKTKKIRVQLVSDSLTIIRISHFCSNFISRVIS